MPGRARGIRLCVAPDQADPRQPRPRAETAGPDDALRLPVLGQVAAGRPIGADIGSDAVVLLDRVFFSPTPDYLLKVKGDSMRDEGIFDGDLIGVHRTGDARIGTDRGRTHRRRDHGEAAEDRQGPDPPAAAQSRLRANRGRARSGFRHRRSVLRSGEAEPLNVSVRGLQVSAARLQRFSTPLRDIPATPPGSTTILIPGAGVSTDATRAR
jgi:hypothetical protein